MKKSTIIKWSFIPVVFCLISLTVKAQTAITVNLSDYNLSSIAQMIDTMPLSGIVPGNAGAGQAYNFASLHSHVSSPTTFMAPSAGVLGTQHTYSNVCMYQDGLYLYLDSSSTYLNLFGVAGNLLQNGENNAQMFSNPQTIITFPSTFI